MNRQKNLLDQTCHLVRRLERIYVDSIWARRSSGHRGNLLKWIDRLGISIAANQEIPAHELDRLQKLIDAGYAFLEKAAKEHMKN